MLVSPAWVVAHRSDPHLVLLHIGDRAGYDREHIPGARYFTNRLISETSASGLVLELPPVARLDSTLASLGVGNQSTVVLYFGADWVTPTTRAWLTLQYLGFGERALILDGGLPAWKAAGQSVTAELPPSAEAGRLASRASPDQIVTGDWVKQQIGRRGLALIDARDWEFYGGFEAGANDRTGHLPGARSVPYTSVVDSSNRFLPDSTLRQIFRQAGVSPGDEIVAYCHIGQQATAVVFAARLAGYRARLYDGSFQDWSNHADWATEGGIPFTKGALIPTEELARRIARDEVTVIDARSDLNGYLANHLPGARYLHYETLRALTDGVPAGVLTQASYTEIWSRLGIRRDRPVVVYASGDAGNFNATFVAWLLAGFRQEEVYLLDGGYTKWAAENRPLSREYPAVAAGSYQAIGFVPDLITGEHVSRSLGQDWSVLVDVRPADQYAGTSGAQARRGHIPGAISHFWMDDLEKSPAGTVWKSPEALRAAYTAQGILPDKRIVLYCNTGTEASHAYFALRFLLGYPQVEVYVPSWTEWAGRDQYPVEVSAR
jgi:thiosulfate/3-mercaptopyruvate sulfurtransferase